MLDISINNIHDLLFNLENELRVRMIIFQFREKKPVSVVKICFKESIYFVKGHLLHTIIAFTIILHVKIINLH